MRLRVLVAILFALSLRPAVAATAPEARAMAPWIADATREATVADETQVTIAAYLAWRNRDALHALITAASTPGSPGYGHYLTPAQFRAQFAPLPSDVAHVAAVLRGAGLTIGTVPASGLFVEASGPASVVQRLFGANESWYAYRGRLLRAPASAPRLPAGLATLVTAVAGLDDARVLRRPDLARPARPLAVGGDAMPALTGPLPAAAPPVADQVPSPSCSTWYGDHAAALTTAPGPYPAREPWLVCGYAPAQLRAAYGAANSTLVGFGVTVGIVDNYASPGIVTDVNRWSAAYNLPALTAANYRQVLPPGILAVPATDPCGPQGWYEEETLDHEAVHAMAPGANIVYAGNLCTDPANTALATLIDTHGADIITNSYSDDGENVSAAELAASEQLYEQAAAEGITVLFSSGDSGDLLAINGVASGTWSATSPYVTAVGGTSLALYGANGAKDEWGWGTSRATLANARVVSPTSVATSGLAGLPTFFAGAGGGPSFDWPEPSWQAALVPGSEAQTTLYLTTGGRVATGMFIAGPRRVTPDVAMVADPYTGMNVGETYTLSGNATVDAGCTRLTGSTEYCYGAAGGTSLASPLFAGVLALVDQARAQVGRKPVGFVDPALYAMKVGNPGNTAAPLIDVRAPAAPTAVLRGFAGTPTEVSLVTMNSTVGSNGRTVAEGTDTSYLTGTGFDEVTGLGTPSVPALVSAFTVLP